MFFVRTFINMNAIASRTILVLFAVAAFLQDTGKEAERGTDTSTIPE